MNNFIKENELINETSFYIEFFKVLITAIKVVFFTNLGLIVCLISLNLINSQYLAESFLFLLGSCLIWEILAAIAYPFVKKHQTKNEQLRRSLIDSYSIFIDGELKKKKNFTLFNEFQNHVLIDKDKIVLYTNESNFIRSVYIDSNLRIAKYKVYEYPENERFLDDAFHSRSQFQEKAYRIFDEMKLEFKNYNE